MGVGILMKAKTREKIVELLILGDTKMYVVWFFFVVGLIIGGRIF